MGSDAISLAESLEDEVKNATAQMIPKHTDQVTFLANDPQLGKDINEQLMTNLRFVEMIVSEGSSSKNARQTVDKQLISHDRWSAYKSHNVNSDSDRGGLQAQNTKKVSESVAGSLPLVSQKVCKMSR